MNQDHLIEQRRTSEKEVQRIDAAYRAALIGTELSPQAFYALYAVSRQNGITSTDLAKSAGMHLPSISRIISGSLVPLKLVRVYQAPEDSRINVIKVTPKCRDLVSKIGRRVSL